MSSVAFDNDTTTSVLYHPLAGASGLTVTPPAFGFTLSYFTSILTIPDSLPLLSAA